MSTRMLNTRSDFPVCRIAGFLTGMRWFMPIRTDFPIPADWKVCATWMPPFVMVALVLLFIVVLSMTGGAQEPSTLNLRGDIAVHDPSTILQCNGEYWVFGTGPGIPSKHSKDLLQWEAGPRVFTNMPAWISKIVPEQRGRFWAPDILEQTNGFFLYYSVSQWGRNTSAIGLVTNSTLDPSSPQYRWVDSGMVIQSTASDNFNAIDPSVIRDPQGRLWLAFGSFWDGIKMIRLDSASCKRSETDSKIYSLARHDQIEAPSLLHHGDYYYLFVNWGLCCKGVDSTYEIRMGRSREITGPYLDREGVDLAANGGSLFLASSPALIGPGHAGFFTASNSNWVSFHHYDPLRKGRGTLGLKTIHWRQDGWPEAN